MKKKRLQKVYKIHEFHNFILKVFKVSSRISIKSSSLFQSLVPTLKQSHCSLKTKPLEPRVLASITNESSEGTSNNNVIQRDVNDMLKEIDDRLGLLITVNQKNNTNVCKNFSEFQELTRGKFENMEESLDATEQKFEEMFEATSQKISETSRLQEILAEKVDRINHEHFSDSNSEQVTRSELQGILSKKADNDVVRKKVTIEHFECKNREMFEKFMEVIKKIADSESKWRKMFNDLQQQTESKLDKIELTSTVEEIDKKINGICDRLIVLNTLKRQNEAAGTKYGLLKGVKCISCDGNAAMRVTNGLSGYLPLKTQDKEGVKKLQRNQTAPHSQRIFSVPLKVTECKVSMPS